MRTFCEIRSAYLEETPVGNAKRGASVSGGSSDTKITRGAWYIIAATERGQSLYIKTGPVIRLFI
jgi:hypothetical protein